MSREYRNSVDNQRSEFLVASSPFVSGALGKAAQAINGRLYRFKICAIIFLQLNSIESTI